MEVLTPPDLSPAYTEPPAIAARYRLNGVPGLGIFPGAFFQTLENGPAIDRFPEGIGRDPNYARPFG